jgi:hypothetical protein
MEKSMKKQGFRHGFSEFFSVVGSAIAVSSATRERRSPRDADLERLGIDPQQYRTIRHW